MLNFKFVFLCLSLVLVLSGCSTPTKKTSTKLVEKVNLADLTKVKGLLISQYRLWKGAPYKYGGASLNGVDCSAFVQNTFKTKLGYQLPRTTRTQIKQGRPISKSSLKVGDVVFFMTGKNSLHNGIYIGKSQFVHASTSKGVTVSNLNNVYWKRTYHSARRIR